MDPMMVLRNPNPIKMYIKYNKEHTKLRIQFVHPDHSMRFSIDNSPIVSAYAPIILPLNMIDKPVTVHVYHQGSMGHLMMKNSMNVILEDPPSTIYLRA